MTETLGPTLTNSAEVYSGGKAFLVADQIVVTVHSTYTTIFAVPVIASHKYKFKCILYMDATSGGYRARTNITGTYNACSISGFYLIAGSATFQGNTASNSPLGQISLIRSAAATDHIGFLEGYINVATSGNFVIEGAKRTAGTSVTFKKGSCVFLEDVT